MSLACEAEVHVQNEHALRFSIVSKPVPLLEYIRTISSLVGASHILAIFEENESLKVFFDDKRYVDALIRSGIHVMGHHVRIDYVVPPGIKVVLSNVDPIITNIDVVRLLSAYGAVVSPVIRPPLSDDTELCHIGYGVRYVYMTLNGGIPSKIDFKYGDQLYTVKARIDDRPAMIAIPFIKSDDSDSNYDEPATMNGYEALPGPSGVENGVAGGPIVVNVDSEQNSALQNSTLQIESSVSLKLTNKVRRGRKGKPRKECFVRRKKITPTSQAARRIKKSVKQKFMSVRMNNFKKVKRGRGKRPPAKSKNNILSSEVDTISIGSSDTFSRGKRPPAKSKNNILSSEADTISIGSTDTFSRSKRPPAKSKNSILSSEVDTISIGSSDTLDPNAIDDKNGDLEVNLNVPYKPILDMQQLLLFLDEVKGHRAPIELARKYMGDNYNINSVQILCQQMRLYNASHNDINLKSRILRLIRALKESL